LGKRVREDASVKGLGPHKRVKGGICTKKGEGLLFVERGKRRGTSICGRLLKKGIYSYSKSPQTLLVYFIAKKDRM